MNDGRNGYRKDPMVDVPAAIDGGSAPKVQGATDTVQGRDPRTRGLPFEEALRAEGTRPKDERFHDPSTPAHCEGHHHRDDGHSASRHAVVGGARPAAAATPLQLDLRVLLIGDTATQGSTTAAWASSLSSDGVAYTTVTASGSYGSETVALPPLASGSTGNFNGVVIADAPAGFAAGQLDALSTYESQFGVRQIDGSAYPSPSLGQTAVAGASQTLDNTTASLTPSGLAGLPGLKGIVPFAAGTFGTPATADAGAPFTPWMQNAAGQSLAGVYQHPTAASDPQAGVSELSLNFNYNANQLQWLLLAPGLIDWVTQDTHLGLSRTTSARTSTTCSSPTTSGAPSISPPPGPRIRLTTPARLAWTTIRPTRPPMSR